MPISSQNCMFDHLLELTHQDNSNKWSNIGLGEEIKQVVLIEVNSMQLILRCLHFLPCSAVILGLNVLIAGNS